MWQTGKRPESVLGEGLGGQHWYLPLSSTLSLLLWEGSWEPKDSRTCKEGGTRDHSGGQPSRGHSKRDFKPDVLPSSSPPTHLSESCLLSVPLSLPLSAVTSPISSSLSRPFQSLLNQPSLQALQCCPPHGLCQMQA